MADLGPNKINLTYGNLLQVPGGITASLQAIQDGDGTVTNVLISTTGISGQINSDAVVITGGTINGTAIGATNPSSGRFSSLTVGSISALLKATSGVVSAASAGTDYVSPAVLGVANGVATLDASAKLTASQIPNIAISTYLGTVASQAAMLALTGQEGDWCIRSDLGTTWIITGTDPTQLADWTQLSYPTAPVTSVNGFTGAVSLSYSNVGAAPATTGSSILYANGSGGFSSVSIGTGLSFVAGTLANTVTGTVTSASVVTANGFAGSVANASTTPAITLTTTVSGVLKGNGTAISAAVSGTDYAPATSGTDILKGNGSGGFSSAVANTDYQGVITATGLLKGAGAGSISAAVVGTDYAPATTGTSILKGSGTGGFSNAVSGTDYAPATSGTSILKGNGSGGFSNATSGTDYAPATSGTSILYGDGSGGFSNVTVGSGLSFAAGTLASTSSGGSVTTVSVVTANGFAGTVANASTTPAITLTTSVTGLLKGNGTAISAASAGTDYAPATSGTALLKGNGAGGFSTAIASTDYAVPTSGTSILYGNGSGGFSNVTVGSGLSFIAGTLSASGSMTYPSAGIAVSTGSAWGTSKATPTGDLVGTTDTQTLTNKTLTAAGSNTVEATSGPTSTQLAGQRNKIINGAMMIDQRNAGASVTPADGAYTLDRWVYLADQASKCTIEQTISGVIAPAGFQDYLGVTSTAATTITTSQQFAVVQRIEGYNIVDLAWGTASAKTVTLSFWVRSSLTGTFGGALRNDAGNYNYPFSYTISVANTWEYKTITVTGATSGTWVVNNGRGMQVVFSLGAGASLSGTAGAWSTSNYWNATGATQVLATNGATLYITGVQLEKGATATPFENRLYGTELALCQRYYWQGGNGWAGVFNTGTTARFSGSYPVQMRTAPTVSAIAAPTALNPTVSESQAGSQTTNFAAPASGGSIDTLASSKIQFGGFSSGADGRPSVLTNSPLSFSAEL